MRHLILFLLIILYSQLSTYAQSSNDIDTWYKAVIAEFKTEKLQKAHSDRISLNLLSDKYFLPVFGFSYTQLSNSNRRKIRKKVFKNEKINKYLRTAFESHPRYISQTGANSIFAKVKTVNELRNEYKELIHRIDSKRITSKELEEIKDVGEAKYSLLMPSELDELYILLNKKYAEAVERELLTETEGLLRSAADKKTLEKIADFRRGQLKKNKKWIPTQTGNEINHHLRRKEEEIIQLITRPYYEKIPKDNYNLDAIYVFKRVENEIEVEFSSYKHIKPVADLIEYYQEHKTAYIRHLSPRMVKQIGKIVSHDVLNLIIRDYLKNSLPNQHSDAISVAIRKQIKSIDKIYQTHEKEIDALTSFIPKGTYYPGFIKDIYFGNFSNIEISNDYLAILLRVYMDTYSGLYLKYLPQNSIALTIRDCKEYTTETNGFGVQVSRYCSEWHDVRSGHYASPEMHRAYVHLKQYASDAIFSNFASLVTHMASVLSPEFAERYKDTTTVTKVRFGRDMRLLLENNDGRAAHIMRFEENLRRFILRQSPLTFSNVSILPPAVTLAPEEQDFERLFQDLLPYTSGSRYFNIEVTGRQRNSTVFNVTGRYKSRSNNGDEIVTVVKVSFSNGRPQNYFIESSSDRKPFPVKPTIIQNYLKGQYQKIL